MRILTIAFALATVSDGSVGGAEQMASQIDRGLVEAGHESIVVAASDSQVRGQLFGTPPIPEKVSGEYYAFRYEQHCKKVHEALQSGPVELVHMHGFDFHEFLPVINGPLLATLHLPPQWYPQWIFQLQRQRFYLNCVSHSQLRAAPHSPLLRQTIPNGIPIPELEPMPLSQRDGTVMLGRICPEKGVHIGIAAARRAGIKLTIAGRVFGFPEHRKYLDEEVRPRLSEDIVLLGPVGSRRKFELLRSAKCVLVPSLAPETSSLVSMEALACGTPVVAFNAGALPDIVEHGKTGLIVNSMEDMAKAISQLDAIDPAVCRQAAIERFSAERMVNQYIKLYEELIGRRERLILTPRGHVAEPPTSRAA